MVRIITSDITTSSERGKYLGGVAAIWGLSATLGGFVGGAIVTIVSWRAIFLINIPICGLAGLLLTYGLNVPKKQKKTFQEHLKEFDLLGLVLIGCGSAACTPDLLRDAVQKLTTRAIQSCSASIKVRLAPFHSY